MTERQKPATAKDILIVEDSHVQAEILKHILENAGYTCRVAENGEKALEVLARKIPDLIVSDIIMPVMDGYDLCREVKRNERTKNIPLILLTALSDSRDIALALEAGADNFIIKPYPADYLLRRIGTFLAVPCHQPLDKPNAGPVTFRHGGREYSVSMDRIRILDFLLSAYEAAVIQHREFQRSQKELRTINERINVLNQIISVSNSSMKPDALLENILQKTLSLQGFEMGALYLNNTGKTEAGMICYQETGPTSSDLRVLMGVLTFNEPKNLELCIRGIPQFVDLPNDSPVSGDSIILRELGARSLAMLPLISASTVIGALVLISTRKHSFSDQERSLLSLVSTEIGNAVQKILLLKRLEQVNDETNLYLDIMSHDINNVNAGAMMQLELLAGSLEAENKKMADTVMKCIDQSVEIIGNVSTIRRMHEQKAALRPIRLDEVIRNEIGRYAAKVTFHYAGTDAVVMADDLVGQVFTNLIGNSVKFCTETPEITMTVQDQAEQVQVTVADNGPGIPDDLKPEVFDRFRKGRSKKSGKGLGLFITRHLIEGYGGRIWAGDRIPGRPHEGAAIHFVLKRAEYPV
jgi:signal transduction histidine kinase/CheY-like chemotaxis protein